ncbi:MAG: type II secretion system F family protein, partial [Planctomycetota bacterium]
PPTVARMIKAGESTGKLPEVLERIADTVEDDLDTAIKNATQLIEPAMIIFMGATIGGIAIALLLPVFSISSTV